MTFDFVISFLEHLTWLGDSLALNIKLTKKKTKTKKKQDGQEQKKLVHLSWGD